MAHDEEKGLLTGEAKRSSIFTSPTAMIFAAVLVCGAFVGASVVANGGGFHATLGVNSHDAVNAPATGVMYREDTGDEAAVGSSSSSGKIPEQASDDWGEDGDEAQVDEPNTDIEEADPKELQVDAAPLSQSDGGDPLQDAVVLGVEGHLKNFLGPFKKTTTPELMARAKANLKAVVDSGKHEDLEDILRGIDKATAKSSDIAAAIDAMDTLPDPDWMSDDTIQGRRRALLGGEGEKSVMGYAADFAEAMSISEAQMLELFPKMGTGAGKVEADLIAKGDDATVDDRLVMVSFDLAAVAARAAPAPFGKASDDVFKTAWGSLMKVLPNVDVGHLSEMLSTSD